MDKNKFQIPEMEIVEFETVDVITTSGGGDDPEPQPP